MFVQNVIELSAAVHELSWVQTNNSDEHNTVRRYRADSKKFVLKALTLLLLFGQTLVQQLAVTQHATLV